MAATICILLLTALMARVGSADVYTGAFAGAGSGFGSPMTYISPIKLPQLPGFNIATPPPLPWPSNFPFPNFPQFSDFPPKKSITVQEVASQGAIPGTNFNGVFVSSQQTASRGKNGEVDRLGGSTFIINDNGKITVHKTGNAPPDFTFTEYKSPPFGDFEQPEFKQFKSSHIKDPDFDFPPFESIKFDPIDKDTIRNTVPGSNEKFKGSSYSFDSFSDDRNGVKSSGGQASILTNDNGKVDEKAYSF